MFNRAFLTDAGIRVLRTFLQTLVGALGLDGTGVVHSSWRQAIAVAGSAAILSALTQLASVTGKAESAKPSEGPGPVITP